jgi:peptidoglycan-N-acetylglucosamine deacetylase
MASQKQIFQTASPLRWNIFKWAGRIISYLLLLTIPVIIIALYQNKPLLPRLFKKQEPIIQTAQAKEIFFTPSENKKYTGINAFLQNKKDNGTHINAGNIRAAFYVNWDAGALNALENHISKLNMVLPQWFFIDPAADTLVVKIDAAALALMQKYPVKILPVLSNLNTQKGDDYWDNDILKNTLGNSLKRKKLVADIISKLNLYHLQGVNIDFEEWDEGTFEYVKQFQKELYDTLQRQNKIISQDVLPVNKYENNDAVTLADYNDYIFLMAYNQHWGNSHAGDICEQKWIEKVLDEATKKIPNEKLILCLAGFGYDWKEKTEGTPVKYCEALALAFNNKAVINFDNDTYNSHFEYTDDNDNYHEVYFFDAAGIFNTMRLAAEMETAGTALWRLGSEDERMWTYYDRDLSTAGLKKNPFDFAKLKDVAYVENTPTYTGEGEVLDVQSYPQSGQLSVETDSAENIITEQHYTKLPTQFVIKKWGTVHNQVVLTFDDGPDATYTPKILDILEKEKVPASFFITGENAEDNLPLLKRINKNGFEIGNHTFSHPNISKVSTARALLELKSTRLLIEAVTGKSTVLFRAPYNADSEPTSVAEIIPIALSKQANYYTIGESIDPRDWEKNITADSIYTRTIQQYEANPSKGIILLHDAGGNRQATVEALPKIIAYFKTKGVQITSIGNILGKSPQEIMPPVNSNIASINNVVAFSFFGFKKLVSLLFITAFIFGLFRIAIIMSLALLQRKKSKSEKNILLANTLQPAVSIIVPAYNEGVTIEKTLQNLLQQQYANFNIIFVDDGSTDDTYKIVLDKFGNNTKIEIFTKENGGKASALNFGIAKSNNNFVVCIDADTVLLPDAVGEMMRFFSSEKIGAVAGNVKVGNTNNLLTNWQSIEYINAQNIDRRAFDYINGIAIVPGAIGAFRKEAVIKAGGFTSDTLAEDCDLTIRINTCGYTIRNCNSAIAMTEAPETIKPLLKQRFRWNYGVMQSFWKNRKACFNPKYKGLGLLGLPNILLFQILLPLLSPIADLFFIASLFWQNNQSAGSHNLFIGYIGLLIIDLLFSAVAFYFEGEPFKKLWYVIPQRIIYKPLMYIVIIKSVVKVIKGETQQWGSLKRTGNVNDVTAIEPVELNLIPLKTASLHLS